MSVKEKDEKRTGMKEKKGKDAQDLTGKRITVTGGRGFLGGHLLSALKAKGYRHVSVADLPEYDLVNADDIRRMYETQKPHIVIHLAAKVGGIGYNQQNPATLFYENALMGTQLIHEGHMRKIDKFVALGTICAYPKFTPVPFREDHIWDGYPEETNAPYGLAKKMMLVQSQAYRTQYGFNSIFLLPVNLYGPGDNFDFASSHVIPALIRKLHLGNLLLRGDHKGILSDLGRFGSGFPSARRPGIKTMEKHLASFGIGVAGDPGARDVVVEIWGSGKATREFFYAGDAAGAIVMAMERYNSSEPVNIGAGFEISIKELVRLLVDLMGFKGRIVWNKDKPDGQPRRMLDTGRAKKEFGFKAGTSFRDGLKKTIEWYLKESKKQGTGLPCSPD